MTTIVQWVGMEPDEFLDSSEIFIGGCECEIESVAGIQQIENFTFTTDGSLRNNGAELISFPMNSTPLIEAFTHLHAKIKLNNRAEAFSSRTSTHVHVNCRPLELPQVKNIVLLYALFEEIFFAMVHPTRRNNIHCVPLTDTILPKYYTLPLELLIKKWHKYTALNILPITKLGTIEFRHLQGTGDPKLFTEWVTALENLWNVGKVVHITPDTISDERVLKLWFSEIFGHSQRIMALKNAMYSIIKNSVIDIKLSMVKG